MCSIHVPSTDLRCPTSIFSPTAVRSCACTQRTGAVREFYTGHLQCARGSYTPPPPPWVSVAKPPIYLCRYTYSEHPTCHYPSWRNAANPNRSAFPRAESTGSRVRNLIYGDRRETEQQTEQYCRTQRIRGSLFIPQPR